MLATAVVAFDVVLLFFATSESVTEIVLTEAPSVESAFLKLTFSNRRMNGISSPAELCLVKNCFESSLSVIVIMRWLSVSIEYLTGLINVRAAVLSSDGSEASNR